MGERLHEYAYGLIGGLIMGVACSGLMLFNGRILGVSGVLGGAFTWNEPGAGWRRAFLGGMLACGAGLALLSPDVFSFESGRSLGASLFGGLFVGAGTQLGSGCTSGHGICGIGRGSKRSIAATLVFMFTGAAAVLVIRAFMGGTV